MRTRLLTTLCAMVLLFGACGSDDGSTNADVDGDTAPTTAAQGSSTEDEPTTDENAGGGQGLPPGGSGTVTVDGETIEPAWVGNCQIDEQFDPQPGDLDVNVSLDGGLEALFLEISMSETMGVPADASYTYTSFRPELQLRSESGSYVNYEAAGSFVTGPDGTWYLDEIGNVPMALAVDIEHDGVVLDEPPLVIDGDRLAGAVTFEGEDGSIPVTFDLTITDPVDCSL